MTDYKCSGCGTRLNGGSVAVAAPADFCMSRDEALVEGDILCGPEGTTISECLHEYRSMERGADTYVTTLEEVKQARQPAPTIVTL